MEFHVNRATAILLAILLLTASLVDGSTPARNPLFQIEHGSGLSSHANRAGAQFLATSGAVCGPHYSSQQRCLTTFAHTGPGVVRCLDAQRHVIQPLCLLPLLVFVRPDIGRSPPFLS